MHIELTEVLRCPDCGPGHGLVAFVERIEDRRIVAGRLDCPVCERRHPVVDGVLRLGAAAPGEPPGARAEPPPGAAVLASALLGPPPGPETLLLAGDAAAFAPELAAARPSAAVLAFGPVPSGRGDRVFPIVPSGPDPALPFRPGAFDGVVAAGAAADRLADLAPLLRTGARLVVLAPRETPAPGPDVPLAPLASDERAWVAERR